MLPFDMDIITAPISVGSLGLMTAVLAPTIKDFDPSVEKLSFAMSANVQDNDLFLHDLLDGSGVEVIVGGRLQVTLMGCVSKDVPEDCLTFQSEN